MYSQDKWNILCVNFRSIPKTIQRRDHGTWDKLFKHLKYKLQILIWIFFVLIRVQYLHISRADGTFLRYFVIMIFALFMSLCTLVFCKTELVYIYIFNFLNINEVVKIQRANMHFSWLICSLFISASKIYHNSYNAHCTSSRAAVLFQWSIYSQQWPFHKGVKWSVAKIHAQSVKQQKSVITREFTCSQYGP